MPKPLIKTPLAIVGMASCVPGANNVSEFWRLLRDGRDAIVEMPPDRLDRSLYYHPEKGHRGKTYSALGGFIPARELTHARALLSNEELLKTDSCHRILCDVALEACLDANTDIHDFPWRNTGVYIGHSGGSTLGGDLAFGTLAEETLDYLFDDPAIKGLPLNQAREIVTGTVKRLRAGRPSRNPDGSPNVEANFASALIARVLRLNGPHFVIDAACASSLVALVAASLALNHGQIDAAIIGGASFNKADSVILFSHAQSCSAQGTHPFDSRADGLISSEGYVAMLVKLLPQAIADGDRIHAVIRGLGLSSDGRGRSLWAPRQEGQLEAVRRAYESGIDPRNVQFIEAHATSTQVGDATEVEALAQFFGPLCQDRKIPIGSVKSNIGHTLETAGLAGLTKTILALKHGEIPPTANLTQLNPNLKWNELPFSVPTAVQPWPRLSENQPRCAAVNAFGIGGLNVHVVVEEFLRISSPVGRTNQTIKARPGSVQQSDKVAIIGRGMVLPGNITTIEAFENLLQSGQSAIAEAPEYRWRKHIGVRTDSGEARYSPIARGGFILNYEYDWKTHKIPPKQVAQANPLQFMLLDAARAALAESGYDQRDFDRSTTAVIVGSIFGGEFGNHLHIGLRLPEIRRELRAELSSRGIVGSDADRLIDRFEQRLLQSKPALLDETGSFTSSTLASRISKTFNLMGGAMALDAGDCSSLAALSVACDLLRSGTSSLVFCAAAQRAMDLPAFESLALHSRLAKSEHETNAGYLPGEGVVVVLLKSLDKAIHDGDHVWGIIEDVAAGMDHSDLTRATQLAGDRATANGDPSNVSKRRLIHGCGVSALDQAEQQGLSAVYRTDVTKPELALIQQMGHTQATHGLVSLVQASLDSKNEATGISTHALSGLAYHALVSSAAKKAATPTEAPSFDSAQHIARPASHSIFRVSAPSVTELVQKTKQLIGQTLNFSTSSQSRFPNEHDARMAIVGAKPEEVSVKLAFAMQMMEQAASRPLLNEKGVFVNTRRHRRPRIAFAFPGQGSQYAGMARSLVRCSSAAAAAMRDVDASLKQLAYPKFVDLVWQDPKKLGSDIWVTQIGMLLTDYLFLAAIRELGITADYVFGHSFGEFPALIAAGSLTLPAAIELTVERTRAIQQAAIAQSGMLSINASPRDVEQLLQTFHGKVYLSHHNAPQQIVVGGFANALDAFESHLTSLKIATRRLNVPIAFHTPLLQPTFEVWDAALKKADFAPPQVPFLSSVTNKFVADPDDIRTNLATQLVTPVSYVEMIQRLFRSGIDVILEIGPQQVLTRLHRRILRDHDVVCMATDHPNRDSSAQICHVLAELDCIGWVPSDAVITTSIAATSPKQHAVEFFDATSRRRERRQNKSRNTGKETRSSEPVVRFDATASRRERQQNRARDRGADEAQQLPIAASPSPRATFEPVAELPTGNAINTDGLHQILIDFVVEQTGYPADLINFDWDLEADLGIDSIKRAQLFGELREMFQLGNSDRKPMEDLRTLRQIADLLRSQTNGSSPTEPVKLDSIASTPESAVNQVRASQVEEKVSLKSSIEQFLISFVVDQTGYPPDTVDLDADFEADLGIDSIKKSQLFGELREQFKWSVGSRDAIGEFRTLRQVLAVLQNATENEELSASLASDRAVAQQFVLNECSTEQSQSLHVSLATQIEEHEELPSANGFEYPVEEFVRDERYQMGFQRGQQNSAKIRSILRSSADRILSAVDRDASTAIVTTNVEPLSPGDLHEMHGLADGAGVHFDNVLAYQRIAEADHRHDVVLRIGQKSDACRCNSDCRSITESTVAKRCILKMVASPLRSIVDSTPIWTGAAVIFGDNEMGRAIQQRFVDEGRLAFVIPATKEPCAAITELERIWQQQPTPHLFIVTPCDADARTTWDVDQFNNRRQKGVTSLFWFCQRWIQLTREANLLNAASIVGVTRLGGGFGFQGEVSGVESGAVTGLLKAILIESWVAGNRTLPIKITDSAPTTPAKEIVDAIWRELAAPSYDTEVGFQFGNRHVVRAVHQTVHELPRRAISHGGNWICTGGARGITAFAARQLACKFGLRLHLLGLSPKPQIPVAWRSLSPAELKQLKLETMQQARAAGRNAIKEWEQVEKAIEIDGTLRALRNEGIVARYHSCDVADRQSVAAVLEEIRRTDGPINGILHGAGIGKDARFDRKEAKRVEECIRAKVDGARILMELTRQDPLQYFVGFGSISGRFGANGHTDYSLANDMLCKLVDWFRHERPEVKSVAFHWHAWGDVGMATKPETKLALEMVGMQFMPAEEGVKHLVAELEAVTTDTEILITDDKYYRMFYPAETLDACRSNQAVKPLPALLGTPIAHSESSFVAGMTLDPARETFLIEHQLDNRPLLPIVIGMELLAEGADQLAEKGQVIALHSVEAIRGLRFHTDRPVDVRVRVTRRDDSNLDCELVADFHSRDGQLVEKDRPYLRGTVRLAQEKTTRKAARILTSQEAWEPIHYGPRGSKMYLGPPLQCLRKIQVAGQVAHGRIIAPALIELAGSERRVEGWLIPSAAIDACLYATGLLSWQRVAPGATLPVKIGTLEFGRMPYPGEACVVETRFIRRENQFAVFDFTLSGDDGSVLVDAKDYYIAWISS